MNLLSRWRPTIISGITILLFTLIAATLLADSGNAAQFSKDDSIEPGRSSEIIRVKFLTDQYVDDPEEALPQKLRDDVDDIHRLFSLSDKQLEELRNTGESDSSEAHPDLTLWFEIKLKPGTDAAQFMEDLRNLDSVEEAHFAPLPAPLPAVTPDFTDNQDYLDAAPDGIDARFSWKIRGGSGKGITIYDLEYSWNQTHEDLSKATGIPLLLNPGDSAVDPFNDENHGTAVLGEVIADKDNKGVTGISWGADIGLVPTNTADLGFNLPDAIIRAVADGSPGDVILIEQQAFVCGLAVFGPVEYDDDVFNAIQIAVANGFVVVEAAGNGGVNLDQAACGSKFDRNVRDSGAIIVGAGGTPGSNDRERLGFSSYGSRVDLQGWGQNVVTTGYGDLYTNPDDPNNPNFWYTSTFNGTSSASPIVAGAAANLQGISLERFGTFLPSSEIRQLLVETGSPQQGDTSENIGTRPDLRAAITAIKDGVVERACPLDARAGRIVVEFPEDVVLTTRSQSENSFGPLTVDIPAGTYDITLVSFDDHIEQPQEEDQKQESWFLQTENEKGDIVFESNPISDLPKAQNILEELVQEHARITKDITGLSAKHILDVGESDTAESVGPVCAAFDRVEKDRDREDKDK